MLDVEHAESGCSFKSYRVIVSGRLNSYITSTFSKMLVAAWHVIEYLRTEFASQFQRHTLELMLIVDRSVAAEEM